MRAGAQVGTDTKVLGRVPADAAEAKISTEGVCLHLMGRMVRPEDSRPPLPSGPFDVAVVGGGVNGVAIARQCALAGRRTLLMERGDFSSGTTSRSTRIIHGGLRYLQYGELGLVRESLREQQRLLRFEPHLVRPRQFLLALPRGGRHSALAVRAGLWLYRRLAGSGPSQARDQAHALDGMLNAGGSANWAIFPYDDAQCEFPERLVAEWLVEGLAAGLVARNYVEALEVELAHGRVRGLRLRDLISGEEGRVEARWVINATGPWADRFCRAAGVKLERRMVGGVRGSHLVLPPLAGMPDDVIYTEARDGRPIFLVPWNGQLMVGTTEVVDDGDPAQVQPERAELAYLLAAVRRLFPQAELSWEQVRFAFAGVRPLPYMPGKSPDAVTRKEILHDHIEEGAGGMVSVIGGKLSTAAALARRCARRIGIKVDERQILALAAGEDLGPGLERWTREVAAAGRLSAERARALADWHGPHALRIATLAASDSRLRAPLCDHTPHLVVEAVHGFAGEMAATLGDILLRRVPVALGACWSQRCTEQAARRIGEVLGWNEAGMQREVDNFLCEQGNFLKKPVLGELAGTR